MTQHHDGAPVGGHSGTILVVFELSKSKWRLGIILPGSEKMSRYMVDGGDTGSVARLLAKARAAAERQGLAGVRVVSAYEAGFDGFWLHRWLASEGVENRVLDPASIEVNRRKRRAKSDKIDLAQLMRVLAALERGEPRVCSVARPPSVAEEDAKRRTRERTRLVRERIGHTNRIKGLLHGQGVRDVEPMRSGFTASLSGLRTGDGHALELRLIGEIEREHERLRVVLAQIAASEAQSRQALKTAEAGTNAAQVAQLVRLRGIAFRSAEPLVDEAFYRRFVNRREVGGYFGLGGTPYDSGASRREQGISKAGNPKARAVAVELAWLWLRHQPESELSQWFFKRVGDVKGRNRRIAIVALARKLMVALWRYLETGLVPEGAVLSEV